MKTRISFVLLLLALSTSAVALAGPSPQAGSAGTEDIVDSLTPQELAMTIEQYFDASKGLAKDTAAKAAAEVPKIKAEKAAATAEAVKKSTTTTAPSQSFGSRVSGNVEDFLSLFQIAADGVSTSDDEKTVTIKFNPISGEHFALALESTLSEPEAYDRLLKAVAEPARPEQQKALEKEVDDLGDVTLTGTLAYHRSGRGKRTIWGETGQLWGRDPDLYDHLLNDLMSAVLDPAFEASKQSIQDADQERLRLEPNVIQALHPGIAAAAMRGVIQTTTLQDLVNASVPGGPLDGIDLDAYLSAVKGRAIAQKDLLSRLAKQPRLDELAPLIDNQPQLSVNFSADKKHENVGPDSWAIGAKWEMGGKNLNAVLREYRRLEIEEKDRQQVPSLQPKEITALRLRALNTVTDGASYFAQNRHIFTGSYKKTDEYLRDYMYKQTVTNAMTMEDTTLDRMAQLDVKEVDELTLRYQFTRLVRAKPSTSAKSDTAPAPRLTFTAEYTDVDDNDPMLADDLKVKDRFVASLQYSLQGANDVTLPLTVTYANHGRFLDEEDNRLSAHLTFSFKTGDSN